MAKTAKPKTKIQIAADKAREAHGKAKDANAKSSNATTLQAVVHALSIKNEAEKAERRERFLIIGGGRVGKAIAVIETLRQIANRRSYEYSAVDVDNAFRAIHAKLDEIGGVFSDAMKTPVAAEKQARTPKVFKFE